MDFQKLCNDVLELDPKVRFVGICDNTGEIKSGGLRGRYQKPSNR